MAEEDIGRQMKAQQAHIDNLQESLAALIECMEASGYLRPGQHAAHMHRRRFERLLRRNPPSPNNGCRAPPFPDVARVPGVLHPVLRFAGPAAVCNLAAAARALRVCAEIANQYIARPTRLYLVGGSSADCSVNGIGGGARRAPLESVLRFDVLGVSPSAAATLPEKAWEELASLPRARDVLAAAGCDGVLYAIGGTDGRNALSTFERLLDGVGFTGNWETLEPMPTGRGGLGACAVAGRVYAVGGSNGTQALADVEWYDIETGVWHIGPRLITPRRGVALAAAEWLGSVHHVYAFGGSDGGAALNSVECLAVDDPCAEGLFFGIGSRWQVIPPMPTPRRAAAAAIIAGRYAFVVGGGGGMGVEDPSIDAVECLDLHHNVWDVLPSMPTPRRGLALLPAGEMLYALGGSDGTNASDACEVYDPMSRSWEKLPPLPEPRAYFGAAAVRGSTQVLGLTVGCQLSAALAAASADVSA